jgi:ABC-type transport system substrate-binding protein
MVDLFSKASIGGNNFGRFDDPKFETLIADAQKEVDSTKRGDLYNQAEEELLNNEVGAIPLNWYTGDQVYREGAINYIQPPLGLILWEKVGKSA